MCAEIILVSLSNGDEAVYVNSKVVYSLDGNEHGEPAKNLAENLSSSLETQLKSYQMDVPKDADWNWDDVVELIPAENKPGK